jgi:hypothetical protein
VQSGACMMRGAVAVAAGRQRCAALAAQAPTSPA